MLLLMRPPTLMAASSDDTDKEILLRMFSFQERYAPEVKGKTIQVYTKHYYQSYRRNVGLWLIPSMYTIARGKRKFLSEEYSKITLLDSKNYQQKQQVFYSTIPYNGETMSILDDFKMPNLYGTTLYGNHLLSPFCRENSKYYKYKVSLRRGGMARVDFLPRLGENAQLVNGTVILAAETGRILEVVIQGEYDLIDFYTTVKQDKELTDTTGMPKYCQTNADFKFLGNHIASTSTTILGCDSLLPDTTYIVGDRELMGRLRPIPLTKLEKEAQQEEVPTHVEKGEDKQREDEQREDEQREDEQREDEQREDEQREDEQGEKDKQSEEKDEENTWDHLRNFGYNLGTHLVTSHSASNKHYYFKLSPILQPQYVSYSQSRGLSYKLWFSFEYYINNNQGFYLDPTFGYNFKLKQVFVEMPLRFVYNKRKNNYLQLAWETGNRIGNSSILEELKNELGELPKLDSIPFHEFDDSHISLRNFTQITPKLRLELGCVFHQRTAVHKENMIAYGKPTRYRSLAPSVTVHVKPWKKGPIISINYERSLKNKISNIDYERWEGKASQKILLSSTRLLNMQLGGGLYTRQYTNYFLDFANFSVNNLPGGWDDEWTGDFQLLDSRLYNVSRYYVSANLSYDAPLMLTSYVPLVGRYVERERLYWSGLITEYTRPYHELGYGFSTRFVSMGLFASFHNVTFQEFGMKFTVELFYRW